MSCGPHRFRCRDKCAELSYDTSGALALPKPLECGPRDVYDMAQLVPTWAAAVAAASDPATRGVSVSISTRTSSTRSAKPTRALTEEVANGSATDSDSGGGGDGGGDGGGSGGEGDVSGGSRSGGGGGGNVTDGWDEGALTPLPPMLAVVQRRDTASLAQSSSHVWDLVDDLVLRHGPGNVKLPGQRLRQVDWVMEGRHIRPHEVEKLTATVAGLLEALPPYPDTPSAGGKAADHKEGGGAGGSVWGGLMGPVFSGRGVVMVGGGMRYLTPAWTNLHLLRKTGCLLPVELWFPVEEFPTPAVEAVLVALGVSARRLAARDLAQRGYGVKVAALLLSSFQEVLFLDSDNAVLRDPTFLFDSQPYVATGALLWPDYWDRTVAQEMPRILNIPPSKMPTGTFESGQMVIDKARHWRGLLVAAYMNVYGSIFSELLSCYVGKGDKETFAYSMLAAGENMWVSPVDPGSAGLEAVVCSPRGGAAKCQEQFLGNTMVQYGTDGEPLFFHANYHKWDLAIPDSFDAGWNRRWQVMQPSRRSITEALYINASSGVGYDVERYVYDVLRAFRCAPWFESYHAARERMGETSLTDLDGFHPLPDYITFRDFYRAGWTGNFGPLVHPPLALPDHLVSWYHRNPWWWMQPWLRKLRRLVRKLLPFSVKPPKRPVLRPT